jgi:tetratricopeptide (TPR) repeat protein
VDANLILGVYQYVVGSLPFYVRALGFIGGFHGDRDEGMRRLELVAKDGLLNKYDAQVVLAVLYRREKRPEQAIPLLKSLSQTFPCNNLFRFEQIQMYSDLGDKKSALEVLAGIEEKRSKNSPGYADIPKARIQYVTGNLNFWYGDFPAAFSNFTMATKGVDQLDLNMAVLAWLRLGQVNDLQGHRQDAREAYERTMRVAPESEAASEARGYISKPYKRKQKNG